MRSAAFFFGLIVLISAAACDDHGTPAPSPTIGGTASPTPQAVATPQGLLSADKLPSRDLLDLARRLRGITEAPADPVNPLPQSLSAGDRYIFNVIMMPSPGSAGEEPPQPIEVPATLQLVTPHAYFYVQDSETYSQDGLEEAGRAFEEDVYPAVTQAMGRERSPGIDNDVHVTIFNGKLEGAGGYVSDLDGEPKALAPLSNEREMVYIDLSLELGSDAYDSVLAHELQHLIHANGNPRQDLWINEGLSVVAGGLVDGGQDFDASLLEEPDTQLNEWNASGDNYAHYGAAGLFARYLALQTGGVDNLRSLVFQDGMGISGIDTYLRSHGGPTFEALFADWVAANYTGSPAGYLSGDTRASIAVTLEETANDETDVHQFAADYIEAPGLSGTFAFDGAEEVSLIGNIPHSGEVQWWSSRADAIDTMLTREVDLTGADSATLKFWTWYDIERWYDYGYVEASDDGGETWQVLAGEHTTTDDPVRQAYGPGYTGKSGSGESAEWVEESVDMTAFAGKKVLLRFEYVTDGGLNTAGWAIDDVRIPEIGFSDDAEGAGDWEANGFQRIDTTIPQRFVVQVIEAGASTTVREITLDAANDATIELRGPADGVSNSVIVVAATSENTSQVAAYKYAFTISP